MPSDATLVRDRIVENLPLPFSEALSYRYTYEPTEGFLDLEPGMRLHIERVDLRNPSADDWTAANYLGTTTVDYEVLQTGSEIRLDLERRGASPRISTASTSGTLLTGIPETQISRARFYRLFYLTKFVPSERQRAAILVGAQTADQLADSGARTRHNPQVDCTTLKELRIACVAFEGATTVTVEVPISVNGQHVYWPVGSELQDVVRRSESPEDVVAKIRVRRLYQGEYVDVKFDRRRAEDALKLPLFWGDVIQW
jgi:hypothetical protein